MDLPNGFAVTEDVALREIGKQGLERLRELRNRLYGSPPKGKGLRFRYAPSIVARGEAELFGLSMPRFALRVYLDERGSFVNARRIERFADGIPPWGKRKPADDEWKHLDDCDGALCTRSEPPAEPGKLIRENTCVGDSVLVAPAKLRQQYDILEAELGLAYGEGQEMWGTPFMRHIQYSGGGLCAQAVCFMASALLHNQPHPGPTRGLQSVHSVAEVTALLRPRVNELLLKGLSLPEIVRYFALVGHSAVCQQPSLTDAALRPRDRLPLALRSYLRSGFPIILLPNMQRLNPVYKRNGVPSTKEDAVNNDPDHAVLLVGITREARSSKYLFNDPARQPFLEITDDEIWASASTKLESGPGEMVRFIPVTPARAGLPLESWYDPAADITYVGLFQIAQVLQQRGPSALRWRHWRQTGGGPHELGEFRLIDVSRFERSPIDPSWRAGLAELLGTTPVQSPRWCWLQHFPGSLRSREELWLWDAERPLKTPHTERTHRYTRQDFHRFCTCLIGIARKRLLGGWRVRACRLKKAWRSPPANGSPSRTPSRRFIDPPERSLISSFAVQGHQETVVHWPSPTPCEFYAFMQPDLEYVRDKLKFSGEGRLQEARQARSALEFMAELWKDPETIDRVARTITDAFGQKHSRIVALASFIPEISSVDSRQTDSAVQALGFLVKLARSICARQKGQTPRVVEIVAGSRVENVWPGELHRNSGAMEDAYVANCSKGQRAQQRLLAALTRVVEQNQMLTSDQRVCFALELEPGPLCILNNLQSLREFAELLKGSPLSAVVGFNLDIAHWSLGGVDPATLRKDAPDVWNRIVHAHVSDHGRGHFGDVVFGDVGLGRGAGLGDKREAFREWFMRLEELNREARDPQYPPYSGFVSTELEACKKPEMVRESLHRLALFLSGDAVT